MHTFGYRLLTAFCGLQVLDTLAEIQERHEAVKELEKSLMELHQIFLDMAVLVEAQGEMLDNIEQQVILLNSLLFSLDTPNIRKCKRSIHISKVFGLTFPDLISAQVP